MISMSWPAPPSPHVSARRFLASSDLSGHSSCVAGSQCPPTRVWTYEGGLPGPCIQQVKGRGSVVRFVNHLQDTGDMGIPTSIHLHGMASLPQYDGYADDLIHFDH
jgi:FtsP/CotA-like multicopper oxidase with cupredoxin domain